MATYKVIFHVDESSMGKWKLVLVNIENLIAEFGKDIDVELLANAEGIGLLYKTPNHFKETITRLSSTRPEKRNRQFRSTAKCSVSIPTI